MSSSKHHRSKWCWGQDSPPSLPFAAELLLTWTDCLRKNQRAMSLELRNSVVTKLSQIPSTSPRRSIRVSNWPPPTSTNLPLLLSLPLYDQRTRPRPSLYRRHLEADRRAEARFVFDFDFFAPGNSKYFDLDSTAF